MFDAHQIIFAEGAAAESFYPGPRALATLCTGERRQLFEHFPAMAQIVRKADALRHFGPLAR